MRLSNDEFRNGKLFNGFDYENQCWVLDGIIQRCGHKESLDCGCYGKLNAGKEVA